jgi:hypothetical protein
MRNVQGVSIGRRGSGAEGRVMGPEYHKDVDYDVYEHGQRWAVCRTCGAQWSYQTRPTDFEQVSEGDGYCEGEDE